MSGMGSRFLNCGYKEPKPLIPVLTDTMIRSVVKNLKFEGANFIFVINKNQISKEDFINHLEDLISDFIVLTVDEITRGPASTCLLAENLVDNSDPLIVVNCDQIILDFNIQSLLDFSEINNCDGVIGCFISSSPKNSYIKLDESSNVILVREKEVISNIATNGFHFWKEGSLFVSSAKKMIELGETYNNEFYVAPSYNHLISQGKKILPFFYNLHFPIGTPEDLETYKEKISNGNF